ncbi:MAG: ATP-binding protein, partial [Peptococcaceae bacterium]|nr:ATP-binding protein [Peptococcaceae bacterium]
HERVLAQEQNATGNLARRIEDMIHLNCPASTSKSLFIQLFNLATTAQAFFTEKKAAEVCDNIGKRLEDKGIVFSGVTFSQDLQSFVFANGVSAMYEASGVRKFGLLWLLIKYKLLELSKNSVLFWDEPENSLNPELVPVLVDILLELSQKGVQVFIATHSYDIARWFELSKKSDNTLRYLNLRKEDDRVVADVTDDYISLENNLIDEADDRLFKRVVEFSTEKAGVKLK